MLKFLANSFIVFLLFNLSGYSDTEAPTYKSIKFGVFKKVIDERFELTQTKNISISKKKVMAGMLKFNHLKVESKSEKSGNYQPPKYWGHVDNMTVTLSPDGRKAVVVGMVDVDGEFLGHSSWSLEVGDPAGLYKMRLFINDKFQKEFLFNVLP